jgi:hypothetical protein
MFMDTHIIVLILIFIIAVSMSMVGKGGGNFYVLVMVFSGLSMHLAASTAQVIMAGTAISSMLIFNKNKKVDWKLALVIDPPTDIMAFVGGYFAGSFQGTTLKLIFAVLLIIISIIMFIPVKEKTIEKKSKYGYWHRNFEGHSYTVNLWYALPITAIVGFFAGSVGISGGAFKIPLMVMLCGVPIEIAIGTSSAMVVATAIMGFAGHSINGVIDLKIAIPFTVVAIIGGILGSKYAIKSKPKNLQKIFAGTNIIAALLMLLSL